MNPQEKLLYKDRSLLSLERRVAVTEQRNSQEMYFVAEDGVFFHIGVKNKEEAKNLQPLLTVDRIRESHGGEWVPLPYWVKYLLLECERMGQALLCGSLLYIACILRFFNMITFQLEVFTQYTACHQKYFQKICLVLY